MAAALSPRHEALLKGRNYAHLATLMPDGSPHVAPVWVDVAGGVILVNTADGRVKVQNVRRDPRVALSVHDQEDPSNALVVRGVIVEIADEGAEAHIDAMSRKYDGEPWQPVTGQRRLILKIRPDHVSG